MERPVLGWATTDFTDDHPYPREPELYFCLKESLEMLENMNELGQTVRQMCLGQNLQLKNRAKNRGILPKVRTTGAKIEKPALEELEE
jgi:geranylgeranyl pyrophosphate synthase